MNTRQAIIAIIALSLLAGPSACASSNEPLPTPIDPSPTETPVPASATSTIVPVSEIPPTPTATVVNCLTQPGQVKQDSVTTTNPPQEFLVYLPPCYDQEKDVKYPVLYLLHGQTYTDDQWVRLGADRVADYLINSGQAAPFIIIFPDDRYWNLPPGTGFGDRLLNLVIPYVDQNYRTLADRDHRSIGGLSRGGGWTTELGFNHPELFGSIGLHSPAVFRGDASSVEQWIKRIPTESRPRLWVDVGDEDSYLEYCRSFVDMLSKVDYPYEFHVYSGDHSEYYWSQHLEEYLRWYVDGWTGQTTEQ